MKLEPSNSLAPEALSVPRAEIISRIWQAVAFLEEVRGDLARQVRQSKTRDAAAVALTSGEQQLVLSAGILAPKAARIGGKRTEKVTELKAARG